MSHIEEPDGPGRGIRMLEGAKFLLVESPVLESHSPLESRIQVPLIKTEIQYLESGVQHCLGFLVQMAVTHV